MNSNRMGKNNEVRVRVNDEPSTALLLKRVTPLFFSFFFVTKRDNLLLFKRRKQREAISYVVPRRI